MLTPTDQKKDSCASAALLMLDVVVRWKIHAPSLPGDIRDKLPESSRDRAILELRVRMINGGPTYLQANILSMDAVSPRIRVQPLRVNSPHIPIELPEIPLDEAYTTGLLYPNNARVIHVDVPGFLTCTLWGAPTRWSSGRMGRRLVYASTPLLQTLGLPGGSYETLDAFLDIS